MLALADLDVPLPLPRWSAMQGVTEAVMETDRLLLLPRNGLYQEPLFMEKWKDFMLQYLAAVRDITIL